MRPGVRSIVSSASGWLRDVTQNQLATGRKLQLVPAPGLAGVRPELDRYQQAVVTHESGPLLVLAGPGTGKTTTLVESVVARIEAGADPESLLVVTFSRRAAVELRQRITARLGRSTALPSALTFHSLCHALLRRYSDEELWGSQLRLLTAPEQEFRLREVLAGSTELEWPAWLAPAQDTRGLASELRAVLARARQLGMDPEDLTEAGESAGKPEWVSVGEFFEEYLDVLDAEQVMDYSELVHRTRLLLADPEIKELLQARFSAIFIDEYQDTDPAQIGVLRSLSPPGGTVVAFGDPDQSIYAFRGAEARALSDFGETFTQTEGTPAPVLALLQTRRFGAAIAAAASSVASRLPFPPGLDPELISRFRRPQVTSGRRGRVNVYTCDSAGAEAEHIADLLRQAHLQEGTPWQEMAVIVRSGRVSIPILARALTAAGVSVEVAGDEIPLATELAVRPLLLALQVAGRRGSARPASAPQLDADEAQLLLTSRLGGLDGMGIRRLGRQLRAAERLDLHGAGLPRPSAELIRQALVDPEILEQCPDTAEVRRARRLATVLRQAERGVADGASAEEVLWGLWSATSWPQDLRRAAVGGGEASGRANRDLDAVCSLFDIAARSSQVSGQRGVAAFVAEVQGQQIPADTQREADLRGGAVRLLTAHRAKGLEWNLVVVASVQEGLWPDLRARAAILAADTLDRHGLGERPPASQRLAEERRLFYVACTRAREHLIVTAVEGTEGEGDQPSRFVGELATPIVSLPRRPQRPMSLTGLVGELRRAAEDPTSPLLQQAAADRLARLADATDEQQRVLVPAADPTRWWGMRELSVAPQPTLKSGDRLTLSASQLTALLACPRQWFLSRQARADLPRGSAASVGSVVHSLIEHAETDADAELVEQLDRVWDQIPFDAAWMSAVQREQAESALERFLGWHQANPRELLGREVSFRVDLPLGRGGETVTLVGAVDRLERDSTGRLWIVDFKTSKNAPTKARVEANEQLGFYQLAAQLGAFDASAPGERRVGGAQLVFLAKPDGATPYPKVFTQPSLDQANLDGAGAVGAPESAGARPTWVHELIAGVVETLRGGTFPAQLNPGCKYCAFKASCPAQRTGKQVVS